MKSPSDTTQLDDSSIQRVTQQVNAALDDSVDNLPQQTRDDLYRIRRAALQAAQQPKSASTSKLGMWLQQSSAKWAVSVAAALLIALSLPYGSNESIPPLPIALLTEDVPTEDLTLLEDLEFVTWLAENEAQALL